MSLHDRLRGLEYAATDDPQNQRFYSRKLQNSEFIRDDLANDYKRPIDLDIKPIAKKIIKTYLDKTPNYSELFKDMIVTSMWDTNEILLAKIHGDISLEESYEKLIEGFKGKPDEMAMRDYYMMVNLIGTEYAKIPFKKFITRHFGSPILPTRRNLIHTFKSKIQEIHYLDDIIPAIMSAE